MINHYGRLFRYRSRDARSPLEDFLTEALADLLGRLPVALFEDFVTTALLRSESARACWNSALQDRALASRTQQAIHKPDRGFIDLLIEDGDARPLIVVESKIFSPIRARTKAATGGDELSAAGADRADSQLALYERWLSLQRRGEAWPGAIVFLTHGTAPPASYLAGEGAPATGLYRSACTWREVALWLAQAVKGAGVDEGTGWRPLAIDLGHFLRENEMSPDLLSSRDLASLEVFSGSYGRLQTTFEQIATRCGAIRAKVNRLNALTVDDGGSVWWAWAYPKPPYASPDSRWFVAWGLRFPEQSTWWQAAQPPLPTRPHAFVHIGSDGAPLRLSGVRLSSTWSSDPDGPVTATPLSGFRTEPEAFTAELADWVASNLDEALDYLQASCRS